MTLTFTQTAPGWYCISNETGISIETNAKDAYALLSEMYDYAMQLFGETFSSPEAASTVLEIISTRGITVAEEEEEDEWHAFVKPWDGREASPKAQRESDRRWQERVTIHPYPDEGDSSAEQIPTPLEVEVDELVHTDAHPQCDDPTCPCHRAD